MSPTPFHDPYDFVGIPRTSGLWLSPDGKRLVTSVTALSADGKRWVSSLWEVDPAGDRESRQLTRSASGESNPVFLPDGSLVFTSSRPDPADGPETDQPALWLLPSAGGEARRLLSPPGGVNAVAAACDTGALAFATPVMPGAAGVEEDEQRRRARANAGVTALLHESHPIRYWDHDLGPAELRLFVTGPSAAGGAADDRDPGAGEWEAVAPRDLTPEPGRALDERHFELTPNGRTVVADWYVFPGGVEARRLDLVAIDTATAKRRVLASDPACNFSDPAVAPDGGQVVCVRERLSSYDEPPDKTLWLLSVDGSGGRDLTPDLDLWPSAPTWSPDGRRIYFVADEDGRRPVFSVEIASARVSRVTGDHGAYSALRPAPDGRHLYALRGSVDEPPTPVRLEPGATDQEPQRLRGPATPVRVPGTLADITAAADDGRRLRAWLALPSDAGTGRPAPLLLWIHGGPLASWNDWHWRWNPWVAVAHGYGVLLPDPALSTGYGQEFLRRGWGAWGDRPYSDLMAITDAAVKRDDVDSARTAAMGGSFGGYMANWVAGHTDRFDAIVTHASLWALDQMKTTTDVAAHARREFGDPDDPGNERYTANSPHRHVANIRTPMLVIHGDRDYRVPIGEALRLWWDLTRHEVEAKFLYFPDENHWILKPGEAALWYQTILAFLDHHVLGEPWQRPSLL